MSIIIAKLSAISAVLYIVIALFYPLIKPVSNRHKRRSRNYFKEKKLIEKRENRKLIRRKLSVRYFSHLISEAERVRFEKIINRLELTIKPEELRFMQFCYSLLATIITIILISGNRLIGSVAGIFIIIGWIYPVTELEEKIEKKNKNIAFDFPAFYSMIYYQYSKSVNIYLADVIKDYILNANEDMAEELGVMIDNIEYGEEYALKQLKKRIPIHYIIKFCDIMETRLRGYDNVSQMTYLKNEIDEYRIRNLEQELERREKSSARVQLVLVGILFFYIAIYYIFMLLTSIKMFQ